MSTQSDIVAAVNAGGAYYRFLGSGFSSDTGARGNTLTPSATPPTHISTGIDSGAQYVAASGESFESSSSDFKITDVQTISWWGWARMRNRFANGSLVGSFVGVGAGGYYLFLDAGSVGLGFRTYDSSGFTTCGNPSVPLYPSANEEDFFWAGGYDSATGKLWCRFNASYQPEISIGGTLASSSVNLTLGHYTSGGGSFGGDMWEVGCMRARLTTTMLDYLYNGGTAVNPFASSPSLILPGSDMAGGFTPVMAGGF